MRVSHEDQKQEIALIFKKYGLPDLGYYVANKDRKFGVDFFFENGDIIEIWVEDESEDLKIIGESNSEEEAGDLIKKFKEASEEFMEYIVDVME